MKYIDKIPLTELVGNLQTYEIGLGLMEKDGKSRNLALKGIEEEIEDFEDEDESEDECKGFGHMRIKCLNYLMKEKTKPIKTVKFQRLTGSFEEIRMEEDETFDEFYAKLMDVVNSAFNFGESIAESKIVRKILRSLKK